MHAHTYTNTYVHAHTYAGTHIYTHNVRTHIHVGTNIYTRTHTGFQMGSADSCEKNILKEANNTKAY